MAASPYLEGGALCALGLIHANKADQEVLTYLENALDNTQHAVSACFASAPTLARTATTAPLVNDAYLRSALKSCEDNLLPR